MGDRGETLREILTGFNSMQQTLGLLPPQTGTMPLGVALPGLAAPPPVMSPADISAMANQAAFAQMQNTMAMTQQMRYMPPPMPAPMYSPTLSAMGANQMSPYMANFMGGGMNLPSPSFATAPQYGVYRPSAPMMAPPRQPFVMPSVFNPFVAQPPMSPHFSGPADYQNMMLQAQVRQGAALGPSALGGIADFGLSALGGAMGARFGAVGGVLGSFAGSMVGRGVGYLGDVLARPYMREVAMGQQVEGLTSNFVAGGGSLNQLTGRGFGREGGRQMAQGIIGLGRDFNLTRQTGFNTNDFARITQLAGEQGFLEMSQSPDQMVQDVKKIAQSLKTFMQIAQTPDVREAMRHMGDLRRLGLTTPEINASAINATQFARMAGTTFGGLSQQYGMPGAAMAQGIGLTGGLGFNVGAAGGGLARMGVNAGAFNVQQLALAGGVQGLAQTNAQVGLSAINIDAIMPGLVRRVGAKFELDADLRRQYQNGQITIDELVQRGAQNMRDWGTQGISAFLGQKQELKDQFGRSLGPAGTQLLAYQQAAYMSRKLGINSMAGGFMAMGLSPEQARAMELQASPEFFRGLRQQQEVQGRENYQRQRAEAALYDPSIMSRMKGGIAQGGNALADLGASPFRAVGDWWARGREDAAAYARGERVIRLNEGQAINNEQQRRNVEQFMLSGGMRGTAGGALTETSGLYGLTALGTPGKTQALAQTMFGTQSGLFGGTGFAAGRAGQTLIDMVGPEGAEAISRVMGRSVQQAGRSIQRAQETSAVGFTKDLAALQQSVGKNKSQDVAGAIAKAGNKISAIVKSKTSMLGHGSLNDADLSGAIVDAMHESLGITKEQAAALYNKDPDRWKSTAIANVMHTFTDDEKGVLKKTISDAGRFGAYMGQGAKLEDIEKKLSGLEYSTGLRSKNDVDKWLNGVDEDKIARQVQESLSTSGTEAIALAALKGTGSKMEADLLAKATPEQIEAANRLSTRAGQDRNLKKALERMGGRIQSSGNLSELEQMRQGALGIKAGTAMRVFAEKRGLSTGGFADDQGILSMLEDADVLNKAPELRKAKQLFDQGQRAAAIAEAQKAVARSPQSQTERAGGAVQAQEFNDAVETLQKAADTMLQAFGERKMNDLIP